MGCYTKFLATYETSFWREAGLSGQLTRYTDNIESVASSPVSMVMDAVTLDNNAALVGFFTGFGASHWASKPVCVPFFPSVFLPSRLCLFLSVCVPSFPSVFLPFRMCSFLSVCVPSFPFVFLPFRLCPFLSVCVPSFPPVFLPFRLFLSVSVPFRLCSFFYD
jgi:hypothetical protein